MTVQRAGTRGFTLIELLVVIAIIGVLAGMLLPVLGAAQERAKVAASAAMIKNLAQALREYESDYGIYPPDAGGAFPSDPLVIYLDGNTTNGGPKKLYMDYRDGDIQAVKLLDPWTREYHYRELRSKNLPAPVKKTCANGNPDPVGSKWNHHSYDLWSEGPDPSVCEPVTNF